MGAHIRDLHCSSTAVTKDVVEFAEKDDPKGHPTRTVSPWYEMRSGHPLSTC